jgi:hypothetical protein
MAENKGGAVATSEGGGRKLVMILVAVIVAIAVFSAIWFANQGGGNGDDIDPASTSTQVN